MDDTIGNPVSNFTEQSVKAMEAAYDVICPKQSPTTRPPTTQLPTTQPLTTQTTEQTTTPEPTTGSGEQDRINKRTKTL